MFLCSAKSWPALLLLSSTASVTTAFVPSPPPSSSSSRRVIVLQDSLKEPAFGMEDFEAARQSFERLQLEGSGTLRPGQALPMTANVERLRRMELRLLETLKDSDQAIDPLVELWVKERRDAAEELHNMIQSKNPDLHQEEMALRRMMEEYGPDGWVEPHGRLAVLLFMRGELYESLDLCDYVLHNKPWHFEVAQMMVIALLRIGDMRSALRVRRQCVLPPLQHPKSRKRWVNEMTKLAKERLEYSQSISVVATLDTSVEECPIGDEKCWQ